MLNQKEMDKSSISKDMYDLNFGEYNNSQNSDKPINNDSLEYN